MFKCYCFSFMKCFQSFSSLLLSVHSSDWEENNTLLFIYLLRPHCFFSPCWRLKQKLPPLSKNINCHLSTSFHLISCWVLSASAVTSLRIAGRFSRAHSVEGESGGVRRASLTVHRKWAGNWNRRRGTRALGLINRRLMDVDVVPFLITMGTTKPVISTWPHTVWAAYDINIYWCKQ